MLPLWKSLTVLKVINFKTELTFCSSDFNLKFKFMHAQEKLSAYTKILIVGFSLEPKSINNLIIIA